MPVLPHHPSPHPAPPADHLVTASLYDPVPGLVVDPAGRVVRANRAFQTIVGGQIVGHRLTELLEPAFDPAWLQRVHSNIPARIHRPDGSRHLGRMRTWPCADGNAGIQIASVEERHGPEPEDSLDLVGRLLANLPLGVVVVDRAARILLTNGEAERLGLGGIDAGTDRYQQVKGWWVETGEAIAAGDWPLLKAVRAGERSIDRKILFQSKDGVKRTLAIWAQPVEDPSPLGIAAVSLVQDISQRQGDEAELARAHALLATVLSGMRSILIGIGSDGRVLLWNRTAEEVFGIESAAALGEPFRSLAMPWDWEAVPEPCIALNNRSGEDRLADLRYRRPDGREGIISFRVTAIADGSQAYGSLWHGDDVTAERLRESQLVQAQKLQSIGQLAAGIAHEINTPMQFVGDNTRFLQDAFSDILRLVQGQPQDDGSSDRSQDLAYLLEEIPKAITQSLEGIDRVSKIVRAMKEFSHPGAEEIRPVDLNQAIRSTVTVSRNEWKYVAEVDLDLAEDLPPVPVLPGGFNQVILNLVVNAAHAIGEKAAKATGADQGGHAGHQRAGTVTPMPVPVLAEVSGHPPAATGGGGTGHGWVKGIITIRTRLEGERVRIVVQDSGTGIPPAILPRIFDPFFTTKPVGRGTGQGLHITRSEIVEKLGGTIDVDTHLGIGTSFIIHLPLAIRTQAFSARRPTP